MSLEALVHSPTRLLPIRGGWLCHDSQGTRGNCCTRRPLLLLMGFGSVPGTQTWLSVASNAASGGSTRVASVCLEQRFLQHLTFDEKASDSPLSRKAGMKCPLGCNMCHSACLRNETQRKRVRRCAQRHVGRRGVPVVN